MTNAKWKIDRLFQRERFSDLTVDRQECLSYFQPLSHCLKHSRNFNVHTDPFITSATMTVFAAINIHALNANILAAWTAIAPPFGWTK
jgi:hypothetical protein